jgi:hypothetical protein
MSLSQNSRRRRRLVQGQGGVDLGLRRWKALTVGTAKRAKEWEEGSKRILAYCLSTNRVCRGRWRDTWSGVLQWFGDEVVAHDVGCGVCSARKQLPRQAEPLPRTKLRGRREPDVLA